MNRQIAIDYWTRRLHSPFSPDDSAPEKIHRFDTSDGYTFLIHDHANIKVTIEEPRIPRHTLSSPEQFIIPTCPHSIDIECENPDLFLIIDRDAKLISDWHCKVTLLKSEIEKQYRRDTEDACVYIKKRIMTPPGA